MPTRDGLRLVDGPAANTTAAASPPAAARPSGRPLAETRGRRQPQGRYRLSLKTLM